MAATTWTGPIRIGISPDAAGFAQAVRVLPITVGANANTDLVLTMPKGRILTIANFTSTAFGAATDATIQIGATVGGAEHVAAVSIKAQGKTVLSFVPTGIGSLPILPEGTPLYVRIVQTGAASATGASTLIVEYLPVAA